MEERGMNARIRKLRRESLETLPRIDMERARYFTETYRQYEGTVSIPELRALALKNYFDPGYNMNPGGTLGLDLKEEEKRFLREDIQ